MKSFVLSLVLLLGLALAGTEQAAAAVANDARETAARDRSATYRDSGSHLQVQRIARASINDSGDYYYRSSDYRSPKAKQGGTKKRYAKRTYAKKSKHAHTKKYGKRKHYAKRTGTKKRLATRPLRNRLPVTAKGPFGDIQQGIASFYWQPQRVAAGGWFNPSDLTAAHRSLPFGTRVRVTHLSNGRSVDVKINDRGPYIAGRIIDLSKAAAGVIGMQGQGIAKVKVTVLGRN